jgi:hypothetical protein
MGHELIVFVQSVSDEIRPAFPAGTRRNTRVLLCTFFPSYSAGRR